MSAWGYSTVNQGTANIGTASAAVIGANADRVYLRIQNLSTAQVSLALGTAAVANESIRLTAAGNLGDTYEMTRGWGNVYTGAVNGIAAADGQSVAYCEGEV